MSVTDIAGSETQRTASRSTAQAPGFYRHRVGKILVTVVTDGERTAPLDAAFVVNATRDQVAVALRSSFLPGDRLTNFFNPVVVETESKLVLIDTGNGEAAFAQSHGAVGQLRKNLLAADLSPESIDVVVISHCHPDHVNGLLLANGQPAFPAAKVLVPSEEWNFWWNDEQMARAPEGRMQMLFKNNRRVFGAVRSAVTTYEWGEEIAPGITSVATPGHSIGHTSFMVASGDERVFVQADVAHNPALFVPNPGWHASIDQDAELAEQTRRRIYGMLAATRLAVLGFHFPFPALGHVEKTPTGYRFLPAPWRTVP